MHGEEMQMRIGVLVSVVIPTRNRPELVLCAVESALAQSYAPLEVLVVVDGMDLETMQALEGCRDVRLRVLALEENVGGAEARNIGVRAAWGKWIAFLDDDDVWMPEKLEKQMARARASQALYPIVSSRILARGAEKERVWPRRLYESGDDVSEYLFCRRGFAYGDGMLQTSTLLVKRELLLEAPFERGLKRHQDWDWLLKVARWPDVEIAMLPDALTAMQVEGDRQSLSRSADWKFSLAWARLNRWLMSRRAYSFFITTECVSRARKSSASAGVILRLLWECVWFGQPGFRQMALFIFFCLVPEGMRRGLRDRAMRSEMAMESGA